MTCVINIMIDMPFTEIYIMIEMVNLNISNAAIFKAIISIKSVIHLKIYIIYNKNILFILQLGLNMDLSI